MNMRLAKDCKHGRLQSTCEICAEIEALVQERDSNARLFLEAIETVEAERDALSKLADKWNFECDELREDNKRLAAELAAIKAQEPTGWIFTDDPSIYPLPGTGFHFGKEPPSDAVDCIPLYTRSKS